MIEADSVICTEELPERVTVTVYVAVSPRCTVIDCGETDRLKSHFSVPCPEVVQGGGIRIRASNSKKRNFLFVLKDNEYTIMTSTKFSMVRQYKPYL